MLLKEVSEDENIRKIGGVAAKYVGNSGFSWYCKLITHNAGRMSIRRFLSVMANPMLRKSYFSF
jgi:hypothetical protein